MKNLVLICTAMCLCSACALRAQNSVNDTPIESFELSRYLGKWYEVARFDHSFERGMHFTQAYYSLQDDGTVQVENSGLKKGKFKSSKGKAKRSDAINNPALLRVSFFWPFYSDYRVLMVDPDYQYALVSSNGPNYLWILARESVIPDDMLEAILSEAERRGFDTSKLIWVMQ